MQDTPVFKFALREDLLDTGDLFLPRKATNGSAGWDVAAAPKDRKSIFIKPGQYVKIPLGIRGFIPEDWWYELKPRSSTFAKKHLNALYGTIDCDFENELMFVATFQPDTATTLGKDLEIKFGEKIAQIIPKKMHEMIIENISNEEYEKLCRKRGGNRIGGFGSSDTARK